MTIKPPTANSEADPSGLRFMRPVSCRGPRGTGPGFPCEEAAGLHPDRRGRVPGSLWNAGACRDRLRPAPLAGAAGAPYGRAPELPVHRG